MPRLRAAIGSPSPGDTVMSANAACWGGAAGASTRTGSREGGRDRRGGLSLPSGLSSSVVWAWTSLFATAVSSTTRESSSLVSSVPPTSETSSGAPSSTLVSSSSQVGCHSGRTNGRREEREVRGRSEGVPLRGESRATGVDGAGDAWGRVAASA